MRLLFCISKMSGGGAERVMSILCNELSYRGHQVYLMTNTEEKFAYSIDHNVKCISLYPSGYKAKFRYFRPLYFCYYIRKIAKTISPDIIIPFIYGLSDKIILSTIGLSIPVISSEHTTFRRKVSFCDKIRRFYVNRLATKVTVLTQDDIFFLGKKLPNKVLMHNPLSFPICNEPLEKEKVVLAAGRIDAWEIKGFDTLIRIWSKVVPQHRDWILQIAGDGSKQSFSYLESLVYKYGVQDSVHFLGFCSNIKEIMQKSAIFVLTSRFEGFSMVLTEAMSQQCAVVSFDCVSGPREIITPNESGILVPDQNEKEMEDALGKLMTNGVLRNNLSKMAILEVQRFMPENIVKKWEGLFEEVLLKTKL